MFWCDECRDRPFQCRDQRLPHWCTDDGPTRVDRSTSHPPNLQTYHHSRHSLTQINDEAPLRKSCRCWHTAQMNGELVIEKWLPSCNGINPIYKNKRVVVSDENKQKDTQHLPKHTQTLEQWPTPRQTTTNCVETPTEPAHTPALSPRSARNATRSTHCFWGSVHAF